MTPECGRLCRGVTRHATCTPQRAGTRQQEARIKLINRDERKYGIGLTGKRPESLSVVGVRRSLGLAPRNIIQDGHLDLICLVVIEKYYSIYYVGS